MGCGPGVLARLLAPRVARYVGVDPSGGMVAEFNTRCAAAGLHNATALQLILSADTAPALLAEYVAGVLLIKSESALNAIRVTG